MTQRQLARVQPYFRRQFRWNTLRCLVALAATIIAFPSAANGTDSRGWDAVLLDQPQVALEDAILLGATGGGVVSAPDGSLFLAINGDLRKQAIANIALQSKGIRGLSWLNSTINGADFEVVLALNPEPRWLALNGSKLDDQCLRSLRNCQRLEQLSVIDVSSPDGSRRLSDSDLDGLKSAETLKVLDLTLTKVEGGRLDGYRSLRRLRVGPNVTQKGIEAIVRLKELTELRIGVNTENWDVFSRLGELQRLESLAIDKYPTHDGPHTQRAIDGMLSKLLPGLVNLRMIQGNHFAPVLSDRAAEILPRLAKVESIVDRNSTITDQGMRNLARCEKLRKLRLDWGNPWSTPSPVHFTAEGIASLAALKGLNELSVLNAGFGDDHMRAVAMISSLRSLQIDATHASSEGVVALKQLPQLRSLTLQNVNLSSQDLEADAEVKVSELDLGDSPAITDLVLTNGFLSGRFFNGLQRLPRLTRLELVGCDIDDEAWQSLCAMPRLESLVLTGMRNWPIANLSDVGRIPSLRVVRFGRTTHINNEQWQKLCQSESLTLVAAGQLETTLSHGEIQRFGRPRPLFVPLSPTR